MANALILGKIPTKQWLVSCAIIGMIDQRNLTVFMVFLLQYLNY
ncbi:hypothetical protein [Muriicola sp.]